MTIGSKQKNGKQTALSFWLSNNAALSASRMSRLIHQTTVALGSQQAADHLEQV
jgi:hypothetical protein